jgi:hypothetical protein
MLVSDFGRHRSGSNRDIGRVQLIDRGQGGFLIDRRLLEKRATFPSSERSIVYFGSSILFEGLKMASSTIFLGMRRDFITLIYVCIAPLSAATLAAYAEGRLIIVRPSNVNQS